MTPDRWRQVTEIFHTALARDVTMREAYLAETCRDDASLRADVDALLATHADADAGSFGAAPVFAQGESPRLASGTTLGQYRIEAMIGVGGLGEVYRARFITRVHSEGSFTKVHGRGSPRGFTTLNPSC